MSMPAELPADRREDFLARVRRLPSATLLHIPIDQRERHALILAGLLDRMSEGDADACMLEEARSKLLLGPIARGSNLRVELAKRLRIWQEEPFVELLVCAEEQQRESVRHRSALRGAATHGARARRARHLISEGAYSKATSSLHTETADLDEEAQIHWGTTLLPCSSRPAEALAPASDISTAVAEEDEAAPKYALKGVRFRAMSAAGPSGARPEHLRELVAVRDRRVSNALLSAIGKFASAAAAGELPGAARWILDSRLVFLRKKRGAAPRPIRVGELWRRVVAKRMLDDSRSKI